MDKHNQQYIWPLTVYLFDKITILLINKIIPIEIKSWKYVKSYSVLRTTYQNLYISDLIKISRRQYSIFRFGKGLKNGNSLFQLYI